MEKWENLKVYRNLQPEDVPKCFKEFAFLILNRLENFGFNLKETKTVKKIYRINEEFEQSIYFENSSRWAKNQKEINIYISIKPLYSDKDQLYNIFEAYQVDTSFKMQYPLTQEFQLLAENLIEKIQKNIIPFFDRFSTSEKIVKQYIEISEHYKFPITNKPYLSIELRQLIYECAFLQRDKNLFYKINTEYIDERLRIIQQNKTDNKYELINRELVEEYKHQRQIFDNDILYEQERIIQKEKAKKYLEKLKNKKPSH